MKRNIEMSQERLWTSQYIIVVLIGLFVATSNTILNPTLPLYINDMKGSNALAGLIMAAFPISALLARPFTGNFVDKRGRRVSLILGTGLFAAMSILYSFSYTFLILFIVRFIHGVGFSLNSTTTGTVIADVVPESRLSEGIGYNGLAMTIAVAIGPVVGLRMVKDFSYLMLFITLGVLGVVTFLLTFGINYDEKKKAQKLEQSSGEEKSEAERKTSQGKSSIWSSLLEISAVPTSLVMMLVSSTYIGVSSFLPGYAKMRGIEDISIFFVIYAAGFFVARLFTGKLAGKKGANTLVLPGMIVMIVSMLLLAWANSMPVFLFTAALYGFSYGIVQPVLNTLVFKLAPEDRKGAANATFYCAMDLGIGGGSILWGIVAEALGFSYIFVFSALCVLIGLVAYFYFMSSYRVSGETETLGL
ncbi:MAG: MFS transporter [Clostridia bacterium]|jgi:MFS family permease